MKKLQKNAIILVEQTAIRKLLNDDVKKRRYGKVMVLECSKAEIILAKNKHWWSVIYVLEAGKCLYSISQVEEETAIEIIVK